ncbi:hypothetical protein [Hymenobacter ruricola]|uniref:Uncharacterized protein n=1 Tax=Hymenobacter ruricola TaxID=2791023 RepID=A0ABS0IAN6_9BACT|nr:hypothetical protein [Hymenobacter ruricola]MBF9224010.1 hypothetical protein [Hymenobacter ruricola]
MHFHAYHRSPDAAPAGDAAAPAPKKKGRATRFLPTTEVGITALATAVAPAYAAGAAANAALGLMWMPPATFTALAAELATHLDTANVTKADVSPNAEAIDRLDAEINQRLGNVRTYLEAQYEDADDATVRGYLPALGFRLQHGSYVFPKGQQDRLNALTTLLTGLAKHGLKTKKYGLAYWTAMRDDYRTALATAGNAAGAVSTVVDTKNELLDQVTEVLRAIYYLLRAQYPKTWKAKLRAYGYQEEGY